jgi:hypothetical protein
MDVTARPPTAEPPVKPNGRGISAITGALIALVGTALGIVGSICTTAIAAHYTAKEHLEDRAEARAKDRREALTKAYTAALVSLNDLEREAVRFQNSKDPPPEGEVQYRTVPADIAAALELVGGPAAVKALHQASSDYVSIKITKAQSSDRYVAVAKFVDSCAGFVAAARKDLEANAAQ